MKKILALLLSCAAMCFVFASCSGSEDKYTKEVSGVWVCVKVDEEGQIIENDINGAPIKEYLRIELRSDGKGMGKYSVGPPEEFDWTADKSTVSLSNGTETITLKRDGKQLIMEKNGAKLYLEKE